MAFDNCCIVDDKPPKKRRNRKNPKLSENDRDDSSNAGDPFSKLVGILTEDAKKPHHDIGMHIVELQAQQKIEEEKTKQIDMTLQIKKMEFAMAFLNQKK
jgi:hypothetical protein